MLKPDLFKPKRVYRVRSVHEHQKFYGKKQKEGTYTRTRHFFSKTNAQRSYMSLKNAVEAANEPYGKPWHYYVSNTWGRPVSVEFAESEPLTFMADEQMNLF